MLLGAKKQVVEVYFNNYMWCIKKQQQLNMLCEICIRF